MIRHPPLICQDPVCGMDVIIAESRYLAIYHQMTFHFCSAQCRDHFLEAPVLYAGAVRREDVKAMPKRRVLRIATGAALDEACRRLRAMMGVTSLSAKGRRLWVDHDMWQVSLHQIETETLGAGLIFKGGLHAFRRSLWRFFEHNELENAAHAGTLACSSRPLTPR
ncbi:YHS domain-containing protein [Zoogloea oleivorans]|uniref:YHS domain-containing protein n=1 Tax=Zoogloea oleivorans TaxID=1552750 RepID=A0A6C2CAV5_9RHOO|nr:YHS domain-containing protein [Zoogloea oleivorans]TYC51137.1 YHS domain-containing protein [Zoogloea oleivorans]